MKKCIALILMLALFTTGALAMANPVVEIDDDDAFEDRLNIEFDSDDFAEAVADARMSIISETVGQVQFTLDNVDGVGVDWTLRFTREDGMAGDPKALLGIHDAKYSEPAVVETEWQEDADDPVITIALTEIDALTEGVTMYFWDYNGAHYGLSIQGIASQMQIGAVLDAIFEATIDD